jgi:CRP-like cAMP-binding protein
MRTKALSDKLNSFFLGYKTTQYKRGEIIIKPGKKTAFVGRIKSGYVRVYILNENGEEISMPFFKPVLYFTAIEAMTGMENKFYFEAISNVEMVKAPVKEFLHFFRNDKELAEMMTRQIFELFLKLAEHMGQLLSSNSLQKVSMTIASITAEKVNFAVTHRLIASLTGLTRETVTLQMLKLEKMGLIQNENRKVMVLNRAGLEKI